jgi:hypothetical protein
VTFAESVFLYLWSLGWRGARGRNSRVDFYPGPSAAACGGSGKIADFSDYSGAGLTGLSWGFATLVPAGASTLSTLVTLIAEYGWLFFCPNHTDSKN